jgi:hypothetical protein
MSDKVQEKQEQKQEQKQEEKQEQKQKVNDKKDNNLCMKLAEAVVDNFAELLDTKKYDFEQISVVLDDFVKKIAVPKNKENKDEYERSKKHFTKFLNYNVKFLKNNLTSSSDIVFSDDFYTLFEDGPNSAWNTLQFVVVSYLSFQKQTCSNSDLNYKGMIEKLTIKIEEFAEDSDELESSDESSDSEEYEDSDIDKMLENVSDSEDNQTKVDNLKSTLENLDLSKLMNNESSSSSELSKPVIKTMLSDIKNMLSNANGSESKNILEMSNDLSTKYQDMISSGKIDVNDLVSGVFGLLNDSSAIDEEFGDFDASKLPDTNKLMADMSNDPTLKDMMQKMGNGKGSGLDMGAISSLMTGMMPKDGKDQKGKGSNSGPSLDMSAISSLMSGMMSSGKSTNSGLDMGMMSSLMSGIMSGKTQTDKDAPKSVSEIESEIERMMNEVSEMEKNTLKNKEKGKSKK